jgi:hypothetical protein
MLFGTLDKEETYLICHPEQSDGSLYFAFALAFLVGSPLVVIP